MVFHSSQVILMELEFGDIMRHAGFVERENHKIDSEDYRTSRVQIWCAALQRQSRDFIRWPTREIKRVLPAGMEELQEGEHSAKKSLIRWSIENICSVQSSQLLLEVLAIDLSIWTPIWIPIWICIWTPFWTPIWTPIFPLSGPHIFLPENTGS